MKTNFFFFIILLLALSCYKRPEIEYEYSLYNRMVGQEGGIIHFFENYSNDSGMFNPDTSDFLLKLKVPQGALDSTIVFNFYQFENYNIASELSKGLAQVGTKFIYFVPVYASDGYHEHDEADLTYHLSLNFNKPIEVTYRFASDRPLKNINEKKLQFEFYNWLNNNYKLYKIKIPDIDEWGEDRNIFVQWNQQGYPVGYNQSDLKDIILGYWYPYSDNNISESTVNWELVQDFNVNNTKNTVSFEIEDTDYIYVLAMNTQIPLDRIPSKIKNIINEEFSSDILRAGIMEQTFQIILEDRTVLFFSKSGDFFYAQKYNIPVSNIPDYITQYLSNNFSSQQLLSNIVEYYIDSTVFYLNLSNSKTLLFSQDTLNNVNYLGQYTYDFNFNSLPQTIVNYVNTKYPNARINSVANLQDEYTTIVIYLTFQGKNIKLYFDASYNLYYEVVYGLEYKDISKPVIDYLEENYPNVDIIEIVKTNQDNEIIYKISLINNAMLDIKDNGDLIFLSTFIQNEDLPDAVKNSLSEKFESSSIILCFYYLDKKYNQEFYAVQFSEGLYVEASPSGEIIYAGGRNFNDLHPKIRNYIKINYNKDDFINFDFYDESGDFYYFVYLRNDILLIFDENGNYIDFKNNYNKIEYKKIWNKNLKH